MAIAVCQSSMIAVSPRYFGFQSVSYGLSSAAMSVGTRSVRQPIPVV